MTAHEACQAYQPGHGHRGSKYCLIRCPVHGTSDSGDNVEVWDKAKGGVGVECWTRHCDFKEILKALGVERERPAYVKCGLNDCKSGTDSRIAIYDHSDGGARCVHRRDCGDPSCTFPVKGEACAGRLSKHIWGPGSPEGTLVRLWGTDTPDNMLVVVEGEKAAASLIEHGANDEGLTPVSWRGGAGKETVAVWEEVSGRSIVFWPDNDDPDTKKGETEGQGITAMRAAIAMAITAGAEELYMVDVAMMPEKDGGDAADVDSETAMRLIMDAPPYENPAPAEEPPAGAPLNVPSYPNSASVQQKEDFGPLTDLDFKNVKSFSSTANAIRLLLLCPENLMVSLDDEGSATVRVCEEKTGIWSRSAVAIGTIIEKSLERWQRTLIGQQITLSTRERHRIVAWIARTRSPTGHEALLESVSSAVGLLTEYGEIEKLVERGLVLCKETDLDAQMHYLGALNGVIDLSTAELLDSKQGREKLVTLTTRIDFRSGAHVETTAAADAVEQLVEHLQPAERGWIEGFLGYALRGSPDGMAWIIGPGQSGKTTLLEAVTVALGDYAFAIPSKMLNAKVTSEHSEGMHLFTSGKRLGVASDILGSDVDLDSPLVKGLATGDIKNERRAYGRLEGMGSSVTASMALAFNDGETPRIPLTDDAFMRRLRYLSYAAIPESQLKPKSYRDAFKTDEARKQAVLAWLVDCAMQHQQIPPDTPSGNAMMVDLRRAVVGEEIHDFLTSRISRTGVLTDRIPTADLWAAAVKDHGNTDGTEAFSLTRKRFSRTIRRVFSLPPSRRARFGADLVQAWFGVRWIDEDDEQGPKQGGLV